MSDAETADKIVCDFAIHKFNTRSEAADELRAIIVRVIAVERERCEVIARQAVIPGHSVQAPVCLLWLIAFATRYKKGRIVSKMSLAWHRECYKNAAASFERDALAVRRKQEALKKSENELELYRIQIKAAVEQGRDSFDGDKFCRRRTLATPSK